MTNISVAIILIVFAFILGRKSTTWAWAKPTEMHLGDERQPIETLQADLPTERVPMNWERLGTLIFVTAWLVGWSAGIVMAFGAFVVSFGNAGPSLFLGAWLVGASVGWVFAVGLIYKLITGKPIKRRGGGEL
ncbi:MAG: hypothetical protein AAGF13_00820 [Pseudomonadota bacterium]